MSSPSSPATRSRTGYRTCRGLALLLLLLLCAGCQQPETARVDFSLHASTNTPLIAVARVECDKPVIAKIVEIESQTYKASFSPESPPGRFLELKIPGLAAGAPNQLKLGYVYQDNPDKMLWCAGQLQAPELPADFPDIQIVEQGQHEDTLLLVSSVPLGPGNPIRQPGYLFVMTKSGQVVWLHRLEQSPTEVQITPDGKGLAFQTLGDLDWREIEWNGNVVRHWQSTGLRTPKPGRVPVPLETFHHDFFYPESNEGLWTLSSRRRGQYIDESLVKVSATGKVEKELSLMKILQPKRELYPPHPNFWELFYEPGVVDWGHSNSLFPSPDQKTALVSLRHQDAVVNVNLETGELLWILGRPEKWNPPLQKRLLRADPHHKWFSKQHSAKWLANGHLVLFDNGRERSRVLEYSVDTEEMRARLEWSYEGSQPFFSEYFGDVDPLPDTGNILVTDGARKSENGKSWARLVEVTHDEKAEEVWEARFSGGGKKGCTIYRATPLKSLQPI